MAGGRGNWDLTHPRPWKAEPMDELKPHGPWQVSCPSKAGAHWHDFVVTHVSEVDAKAIAEGGNAHPPSREVSP
jgi:hypothetical protein